MTTLVARLSELFLRVDPRFFVMTNHATLVTYGLIMSCLQRTFVQIALCLGIGVGLELALARLKYGRSQNVSDGVKSALVITLGLLVFLISRHWWFYGVAAAFAILGKNFIRREHGGHAYNPTGLTILVMIAFFPNYVFVRGDQFNGTYFPFFSVLFFGTCAILRADRWRATVSYLCVSALTSLVYSSVSGRLELIRLFGSDFGTEGMLFMFLMFTDPKTCPKSHLNQKIFGVTLAILNVSFRAHELAYSQFLALFIASSFLTPAFATPFDRVRSVIEWISAERFRRPLAALALALIPIGLLAALVSKTESWPLTDYRMFARKKELANTVVMRPAIKTATGYEFFQLKGRFPGHAFLIDSLVQSKRENDLNRVLQYLYRMHLNNGGEKAQFGVVVKRQWDSTSAKEIPTPTENIVYEVKLDR